MCEPGFQYVPDAGIISITEQKDEEENRKDESEEERNSDCVGYSQIIFMCADTSLDV
jgi:hypothetical protein